MRTAAGALLKKVHAAQDHGSAPSQLPESMRASAIPVVVVVDAEDAIDIELFSKSEQICVKL